MTLEKPARKPRLKGYQPEISTRPAGPPPANNPRGLPDDWEELRAANAERAKLEDKTRRPYLLESSNLESEIRRSAAAARAEIEAIEADILSIETRANMDIEAIRARADTEVAARQARRDDLGKILAIESAAFGVKLEGQTPEPEVKPPEPRTIHNWTDLTAADLPPEPVDHYAADTADLDPDRELLANCYDCRARIYDGDEHYSYADGPFMCAKHAPMLSDVIAEYSAALRVEDVPAGYDAFGFDSLAEMESTLARLKIEFEATGDRRMVSK